MRLTAPSLKFAQRPPRAVRCAAFTLLELIVATMIFAILLVAVRSVFVHAFELRREAGQLTQNLAQRTRALNYIRQDLRNCLYTGYILATNFEVQVSGAIPNRMDTLTLASRTGRITTNTYWGDIQEVTYFLGAPDMQQGNARIPNPGANDRSDEGLVLYRGVTRNLLGTDMTDPYTMDLLHNVQSFQIQYFDTNSQNWIDPWPVGDAAAGTSATTSTGNSNTPVAIRINIEFAPTQLGGKDYLAAPLELILPGPLTPLSTNGLVAAAPGKAQTQTAAGGAGNPGGPSNPGAPSNPGTPTGRPN